MVKWCGKSAPQYRQRYWHGKPHRLQDQAAGYSARVGTADMPFHQRVGRFLHLSALDRCSRAGRQRLVKLNGRRPSLLTGHRTRLTDPLFFSFQTKADSQPVFTADSHLIFYIAFFVLLRLFSLLEVFYKRT